MIDRVRFGLLSPDVIKKMATMKVERAELYDADGYPIEKGLMDMRLGVIDPGLRCRVCGGGVGECLGHFGYLPLTKPVVHPLFGRLIHYLLSTICTSCSRVLVAPEELDDMDRPLRKMSRKKVMKCPHCGTEQKKMKFDRPTTYLEGKTELTQEQIREKLEKIPNEDLKHLGIKGGRPEWLIMTILPIPPVTVRPSITLESGERSEDDLTHKLVDVIRINERLKKNIDLGAPDFIISDIWELLQYHVSTLIRNDMSSLPPARHRSGRALKTLSQRVSKKEGRFRHNLSGKRVNFSSRTVVSPDPKISINEVGVPVEVAKEMTIPEKVVKGNLKKMKDLALKGPNTYPGANYIIRPDGVKKKIAELNKEDLANEIDIGYTVERHMVDGDITVFNRQPSLHRMSMMCHQAKVMPYKTFRLNLCSTTPYNADFDGDEMNLHVPQSEEARAEAKMLMSPQDQIRSPKYGLPIIGCIHDQITGCYLLTSKGVKMDRKETAQILFDIGMEDMELDKKEYTGKEVFSFLLPKDLNMEFKSASCSACAKCKKDECDDDSYVVIKDGQLKCGVIDAGAIGEERGKILDRIERKYGSEVAKKFLNRVSRLGSAYATKHGFTFSMSDIDLDEKDMKKVKEVVNKGIDKTKKIIKKYRKGKMKQASGKSKKQSLENKIMRELANIVEEAGEVVKNSMSDDNSAVVMAKTKARGSMINLTQMAACYGQATLKGKRISRGYYGRTLSVFNKGSLSAESRGFIKRGYRFGLNPYQFFFDAMNGREGLADKSLQTRHSGYLERRLINALQDLKVENDGTVRDSRRVIIQFTPGEDNIDPAKSDNGEINVEVAE